MRHGDDFFIEYDELPDYDENDNDGSEIFPIGYKFYYGTT